MEFELSVLFTVKKSKINKAGMVPIYLRITVNGERSELSVNRNVSPNKWDAKTQRAVGRSESAKALNDYLDSVEVKVKRNFNTLLENQEEITATVLRDMQTGKHVRNYSL